MAGQQGQEEGGQHARSHSPPSLPGGPLQGQIAAIASGWHLIWGVYRSSAGMAGHPVTALFLLGVAQGLAQGPPGAAHISCPPTVTAFSSSVSPRHFYKCKSEDRAL